MITFTIPQTQSYGYGFLEFATHVLDYSPAFELRSHMRLGTKAVDAIDAAIKAKQETVSMPDDVGSLFQSAVEKTPVPKLFTIVDGKPEMEIPKRFYDKFYEAAESGHSAQDSNQP